MLAQLALSDQIRLENKLMLGVDWPTDSNVIYMNKRSAPVQQQSSLMLQDTPFEFEVVAACFSRFGFALSCSSLLDFVCGGSLYLLYFHLAPGSSFLVCHRMYHFMIWNKD